MSDEIQHPANEVRSPQNNALLETEIPAQYPARCGETKKDT